MMDRKGKLIFMTLLLAVLGTEKTTYAQKPGGPPMSQPPSNPSAPPMNDTTMQPTEVAPPVSKQENKAIKGFRDTPDGDVDKKTQLGEDFIEKYPQSRYRADVVNWLARAYMTKGQVDKLQSEGDKELALTPNNPVSLAVLGSNLARVVTSSTPDLQQHLDKAEEYCKKSLDALAVAKKPEGLSDEKFTAAKNQTSAVAYSGLGTVAFRRAKYTDAISDLDKAVKLSGGTDPVDYYLLGKSNEAATNFDEALAAYTKCAAISSGMQAACKSSINDVKAHGAVLPK